MARVRVPRAQQGFSLLEVLVTMVVLTVGIIGVAGLLIHARQANEQALAYTRATLLTEDLLERMRANAVSAALDAYNIGASASIGPEFTAGHDCRSSNCSPPQMARFDLADWAQQIGTRDGSGQWQDGLVNARGCVTVSDADHGTRQATVILAWQGSGASIPATECASADIPTARQSVTLSTRLAVKRAAEVAQ